MVHLVYFPLVVLALAALISVGTIGSSGTTIFTPTNVTNSCGIPATFSGIVTTIIDPISAFSALSCTFTQAAAVYIFNVNIQQYGVTQTTTTTCTTNTLLSNAQNQINCVAETYNVTNSTTVSCTTIYTTNGNGNPLPGLGPSVIPPTTGTEVLCPSLGISTSDINPTTIQEGFLVILFVVVSVAVIAGFNLLGSGLNAASIYILFKAASYTIVWMILSGLAIPLFYGTNQAIPAPFGSLFYLVLSLVFLIGIYESI
jgi:hypothetical protein